MAREADGGAPGVSKDAVAARDGAEAGVNDLEAQAPDKAAEDWKAEHNEWTECLTAHIVLGTSENICTESDW